MLGPARGLDHRSDRCNLGFHGGDVGLSAEPWVDGHDQHEIDEVEDVRNRRGRCGRIDGNGGVGPKGVDALERAVQVSAGFGVNDEPSTAGVDITRRHLIRVLHHEVGFKGQRRMRAGSGNDIGPERQVWYEAPIHHIPLDEVDSGRFKGCDLLAESSEVGWQHGRSDLNRSSHDANPSGVGVVA